MDEAWFKLLPCSVGQLGFGKFRSIKKSLAVGGIQLKLLTPLATSSPVDIDETSRENIIAGKLVIP